MQADAACVARKPITSRLLPSVEHKHGGHMGRGVPCEIAKIQRDFSKIATFCVGDEGGSIFVFALKPRRTGPPALPATGRYADERARSLLERSAFAFIRERYRALDVKHGLRGCLHGAARLALRMRPRIRDKAEQTCRKKRSASSHSRRR